MSAIELEHILFRLHSRVIRAAASGNAQVRKAFEWILLAAAVASLGVFVWLHTHYVGPSFPNECLVRSIEGAISASGGLSNVDLLQVRIVSPRTAAFDALKSAVKSKLLETPVQKYSWPGDSPAYRKGDDKINYMACAAGTASCTADRPKHSEPVSGSSSHLHQIADRVATYLVSRQRGEQVSVPTEELVTWTAEQIEVGGDEAVADLALAAVMAAEPDLPKLGDRISARRQELTAAWADALRSGDVLSPYRTLIAALMNERTSSRVARRHRSAGGLVGAVHQAWQGAKAATGTGVGIVNAVVARVRRKVGTVLGHPVPAEHPSGATNESLPLRIRHAPFWELESDASSVLQPLTRRRRGTGSSDKELLTMLVLGAASADKNSALHRDVSYTFTTDKGLLALNGRRRDQLSLRRVELDIPADSECVGDPGSRWLLANIAGYDVPMLNAFAGAIVRASQAMRGGVGSTAGAGEAGSGGGPGSGSAGAGTSAGTGAGAGVGGQARGGAGQTQLPHSGSTQPPMALGWVVSVDHTDEVHALSEATELAARFPFTSSSSILAFAVLKLGTVCSAVFLLFATSSLVSFILAQTQQRMLRFTVSLQSHVRARMPLAPLLAGHMVDSLIFVPIMLGVLFFMFSFFTDQLLAFLVLLAVWVCEVQNIIACRTEASMRIFPRVFGLLMTWFHAYYLAFPFGFAYPAFFVTCMGLVTAGYHLWNKFELPAVLDGSISLHTPRAPAVTGVMVAPWAGQLAMQLGVGGGAAVGGTGAGAGAGGHHHQHGEGSYGLGGEDNAGEQIGGDAVRGGNSAAASGASTGSNTPVRRAHRASSATSSSSFEGDGVSTGRSGNNGAVPGSPVLPAGLNSPGRRLGMSGMGMSMGMGMGHGAYGSTMPPGSPGRGMPLTGLGLIAASSPFTATYRAPSMSDASLAGLPPSLVGHMAQGAPEQLPIGVGIAAARGDSAGNTPGTEDAKAQGTAAWGADVTDSPPAPAHRDSGGGEGEGTPRPGAGPGAPRGPIRSVGSVGRADAPVPSSPARLAQAASGQLGSVMALGKALVDAVASSVMMDEDEAGDTGFGLVRGRKQRDGRARGQSMEEAQGRNSDGIG